MASEVELKAWVDDVPSVRARLDSVATRLRDFDKRDAYFRKPEAGSPPWFTVRVRSDSESGSGGPTVSSYVTFKEKTRQGGIEVNRETEFSVSDPDAARALIERLGATFAYEKRKTGTAWTLDGVLCELCALAGLGTFLELELVLDTPSPEEVSRAKGRLLLVLDALGVSRERIEERYYSELLSRSPHPSQTS